MPLPSTSSTTIRRCRMRRETTTRSARSGSAPPRMPGAVSVATKPMRSAICASAPKTRAGVSVATRQRRSGRRAKDEPPAFSGQPKTGVTKEAMDSAIRRAVADERRRNIETREAERFVRPWVGDMAMAHDSAEAVYRAALGALGIKHEAIREAAALKALIELCPKPGARKDVAVVAMDAAGAKGFAERYPDASRIATL